MQGLIFMRFIKIEELRPGMRLARPIYSKKGVLLFERAAAIKDAQSIQSIKSFGLIGLFVLEPAEPVPPMALEQGREVFAIPGRITDRLSDGCNTLIRQGAGIALSPADLLQEFYGIEAENAQSRAKIPGIRKLDPMESVIMQI